MTKLTLSDIVSVSYRSYGPTLTVDTLEVKYSVGGEVYTHHLPNGGWSINTPTLQFLAYLDMKPSDIDGTREKDIQENIPVVKGKESDWNIAQQVLVDGQSNLKEAEWFNPTGTVWNSGKQSAVGGGSPDPGTGNKGGVDIEEVET